MTAWLIAALFACTVPERDPNLVTEDNIRDALAKRDVDTLCLGLRSSDLAVQQFATEQLRVFDPKDTAECLKVGLVAEDKSFREGVLIGLKGEKRNALGRVVAEMIKEPSYTGREMAILKLGEVTAPSVNAAILSVAQNKSDTPSVRAAAIRAIGGYADNFDDISALFEESNPEIKAAVIEMLGLHTEEKSARSLIKEGLTHEDETVRAAAMTAYRAHAGDRAEETLCAAMMEDASPKVREAAVRGFRKTKSVSAVRCLRQRAMELEENREVRVAILDSLKMAQGVAEKPAFAAMCDAIPFWLRSYVTDKLPEEDPETDIVKMQNDYDHENSEKCFEKAYAQKKNYSCHAHKYIAWFYKQMISNENLYVPECDEPAEE